MGNKHGSINFHGPFKFLLLALRPEIDVQDIIKYIPKNDDEWLKLYELSTNYLVAALLYKQLVKHSLLSKCPEEFVVSLGEIHNKTVLKKEELRKVCDEAISTLNKAGITPTLLKGSHALYDLLPNSNERLMSDIDLLVPEEQVYIAKQTLLDAGYFNKSPSYKEENPENHHLLPIFHPSGFGYLEIHRRPNQVEMYKKYYPKFFSESQGIYECQDVSFNYSNAINLLIYNQVHNYHSNMESSRILDLRQLIEQCYLWVSLSEEERLDFYSLIKKVIPENDSHIRINFFIIKELFDIKVPPELTKLKTNELMIVTEILEFNTNTSTKKLYKRKAMVILSLMKAMFFNCFRKDWIKSRILNREWYRSIPKSIKTNLSTLRVR